MKSGRARVVRLVLVVVCVAWLAWIVASLGPGRVWHVARQADPTLLALSFLAIVARFLIWAVKWTLMLRRRGAIALGHVTLALLSGNFVNLTTPTAKLAGGFVRAALVDRRTGWGFASVYGWSFADQFTNVFGNLTLYGLLAVTAGFTVAPGGTRIGFLASGAAALAVVAAMVAARSKAWTLVQKPSVARFMARFTPERFRILGEATWVRPVFEPLLAVGRTSRVAPQDLGLGALSFGALCLANALVLQALGSDAPLPRIGVAVVIGYFAGSVLGTLGGVGVTEVALIKMYGMAGVSPEIAAAGALLHRASYYAVILSWGGVSLLVATSRRRDPEGST
jgi:uncharacterized membrane protein YbhN (UPF0104 family)